MSVTVVGTMSVASANKAIALAMPALSSMLTDLLSRIAALGAQRTANLAILAAPPDPTALAASITAAAANALSQIANIITAIPQPLIEANASLGLQLVGLNALKVAFESILATFTGAASAGGVHAFKVDATWATVGTELASLVGSGFAGSLPTARVYGGIYLTELPATFTVMQGLYAL